MGSWRPLRAGPAVSDHAPRWDAGARGSGGMGRLYGLLGLVGMLTLVGSLLGYARNASIASVFGLSGETDAYFVAIFIPITLQAVLVYGAISPALVRVYVNYIEKGKLEDARITFSSILNVLSIGLAVVAVLGIVFSRQLVGAIAPGLDAESARLSSHLMSFTLPLLVPLCVAALIGPVLNAKGHFFTPALSALILNAFTIAFIVVVGGTMGVVAAAVGVLLGGFAHVGLLAIWMRRMEISYSPTIRLAHPGVRRVLLTSAPLFGYMGVAYFAPLIERLLASFLAEGTVSIVAIAVTIFAFPALVFNASLGVIVYPQFVRVAAKARAELGDALMQASRLVLVALIPATLLIMVASGPLTRLAYGPGNVSSADVRTGGAFLAVYVIGLTAVGLTQILQRGIYATGDFMTPLKVEVLALGPYVALAVALSQIWSVVGLALARTVHFALVMLLTFWIARRAPGVPSLRKLASFAIRPLLAGIGMVAFYTAANLAIDQAHASPSYVVGAGEQLVLLVASACVYLLVSTGLGVQEVAVLWKILPMPRRRGLVDRLHPANSSSLLQSGAQHGGKL